MKHPARMAASTRTDKPRLPCNLRRDKRAFIQVTSKIVDLLYRRAVTGSSSVSRERRGESSRHVTSSESYLPANPRRRSDLVCQSQDNRSGFLGQSAGDRRIFSANRWTTVGFSRPIRGRPSDLFRQSEDNRRVFSAIHVDGRIYSANRRVIFLSGQPSGFLGQSAGDRRIFSANRWTTVGFPGQSAGDVGSFPFNQRTTVGLLSAIHVGESGSFSRRSHWTIRFHRAVTITWVRPVKAVF